MKARTADGARPLASAWRSISCVMSSSVRLISSRETIASSINVLLTASGCRNTLLLSKSVPVDVRFARIDVLVHHVPRKLFDASLDFLQDKCFWYISSEPARKLSKQVLSDIVLGFVSACWLRSVSTFARKRCQVLEVSCLFGEIIVEDRQDSQAELLNFDFVSSLCSSKR